MKHFFISLLFLAVSKFSFAGDLDSLRMKLKNTQNDSLRAPIYAQLAAEYLKYDTISNRVKRMMYQNEALINSMQALQVYSKYSDTTGMRTAFDYLSKLYLKQQRYSQAKWFTLQSNNLSRIKSDVPNIIQSLKQLAAIKNALKEYKLAEQDINEAAYIASNGYTYMPDSVKEAQTKRLLKKKNLTATVKMKKSTRKSTAALTAITAANTKKNKAIKADATKKLASL
ncbi:hypothetical protein EOD41_10660 [Mucilaginibacter limnophilus]|uniref:Uncharacterized protein n=1 Tax=Mucilaginibacter limnophilus TaxID=1932778 RepID=A0A437MTT1_9SPHI|nr:hypothetical protein [Mucilaginibacter limnophilus]RVU01068.1 hypothetical protein EOD41_10660 [Mucilaginibacter limnophilus]